MVENVALEHSRLNTEAIGIGDLLALPPNVLDRIIGWLDRNEDIFCLLSSSQAVYAAIAQVDWMKLRLLRLSQGQPRRMVVRQLEGGFRWSSEEGPSMKPLNTLSGAQLQLDSIEVHACVPFKELSMSGGPAAASHTIFKQGELRVLDYCAGGATIINASAVEGMRKQPAPVGYPGFYVKHLDVSGTSIRDQDLRHVTTMNLCPLLQRLKISGCMLLTGGCLEDLAYCQAFRRGRFWDLDISGRMAVAFPGRGLNCLLLMWAALHKSRDDGASPHRQVPGTALSLDMSSNYGIHPGNFGGFLIKPWGPCVQFGHFKAGYCGHLLRRLPFDTFDTGNNSGLTILGELTARGSFRKLVTLDLRYVFHTDSRYSKAKGGSLASIIWSTEGCLKRLLIDDGCAGADVAEAIAARCSSLEELSMSCCAGLSNTGLQMIAASCKQLKRLSVGGRQRGWSEKRGLAAFSNLQELEICYRSSLTDEQLGLVLGQHPALEALKLSYCYRVSDKALGILPATSLRDLALKHCDSLQGRPLSTLTNLETLEASTCSGLNQQAMQAVAASCTRLKKLELPAHITSSNVEAVEGAADSVVGVRVESGAGGAGSAANPSKTRKYLTKAAAVLCLPWKKSQM